MKVKLFILLFCLPIISYGQTNTLIKTIFYNLPLNTSRNEIKKKLLSDKRFTSSKTHADSLLLDYPEDTYLGLCDSKGLVRISPDSVEIELTFGYSYTPEKKRKNHQSSNDLYLKLRYYYSEKDSAEKAYYNIIDLLRPLTKDTLITGIDTVLSESPIRSQLKAKGMDFIFHKPFYKVTVLFATITENYYGLFLEYTRKENR